MWRQRHSNDYKFQDRRASEIYTIGGTDVLVHKYVGTHSQVQSVTLSNSITQGNTIVKLANVAQYEIGMTVSGVGFASNTKVQQVNSVENTITITTGVSTNLDAGSPVSVFWNNPTKPNYLNESEKNIQDLLFLENRDRKYESDVYVLRGIYQVSDNDFDLQQFGIFLSADTIMISFHLNDTVALLGRKIMSGDVIELPHLKDYYPLDTDIPAVLKRYYVVQDVTLESQGFSLTWYPHTIRAKCTPLVDSQEYKDILNYIDSGATDDDGNPIPVGQIMSNFNRLNEINDAIIQQAEVDVPKSGYSTENLYKQPLRDDGFPGDPSGTRVDNNNITVDSTVTQTDSQNNTRQVDIPGYLVGDGNAPAGWPVTHSTSFPIGANVGDFVLRTDYLPNRLFRFDGRRWIKVEDNVRSTLGADPTNSTQLDNFINERGTYTDSQGNQQPVQQALSKILKPGVDN